MKTTGLPLVGKGSFTKVYRKSKTKVLIKTIDVVKEAMAENSVFQKSSLFPTLRYQGSSGKYKLYEGTYYKPVKSILMNVPDRDWELYQILQNISWSYGGTYETLYSRFEKRIPGKFWRQKKVLLKSLETLKDYTDAVGFEISPRNLAVHRGRLVLLDCFFCHKLLHEVREAKIRREIDVYY